MCKTPLGIILVAIGLESYLIVLNCNDFNDSYLPPRKVSMQPILLNFGRSIDEIPNTYETDATKFPKRTTGQPLC